MSTSEITNNVHPGCCMKFGINQTKLVNLILYAWFFWYHWILFCPGIKGYTVLTVHDILNGIVIGCILFFALNAAAYKPPFKKYISTPLKVLRFWLIPFCVSTVSVSCSKSGINKCNLFFPVDKIMLVILLSVIISILGFGSLIHYLLNKKLTKLQKQTETLLIINN